MVLQQPHVDANDNNTRTALPGRTVSYHIENIKTGTDKKYSWRPESTWTRNSLYPKSSDWQTVAWTVSKSKTESTLISTSVGVGYSVVSSSVGASFAKSHTISTANTRTFKVPYKKDGRVIATYSRPYKTFTCVRKYYLLGVNISTEKGSGNAVGQPKNNVSNLETRSY